MRTSTVPPLGPGTEPRTSIRFWSAISSTMVSPRWVMRPPPMKHLVEFRDEAGELLVGDTVTVEAFEPGQKVKISGTSKGKGFQGTIKRHNFASGPKSHGSHNVRAPGSIGASAWPARVMKGIRGPGQMGNKRITQKGLEIVEVRAKDNLLMVRGAVPGPRNGVVEVRTDA